MGAPRLMIAAVRDALREDALRARIRNIAHLLTGNAGSVALGMPAVALTARALGPESYGMLALILSYVQATKGFADFQVWQPLIRYGAELDPEVDARRLMALFKYGLMVDAASSLAAWALALAGAALAHLLFGISEELMGAAIGYAIVLPFNIKGTPVAVLRLAGRFRVIAYNQLIAALARLALCVWAFFADAGLIAFVAIWAMTEVLASVLLLGAAFQQLRDQNLHFLHRAIIGDAKRDFPGLVRFTWSSNLSLTIWSGTQQLDTLLVGWLTDPRSAGLYYFVKRIARIVQQAAQQVQAVVFPEVTRLWTTGRHAEFRRVVYQTEWMLAAFGVSMFLAFAIFGHWLIELLAGPAFADASTLLTVQMGALCLTMCGTVMRSGVLAMGEPNTVLKAVVVSTVVFYASAVMLIPRFGAMGGNIAHILLGVTWLALLAAAIRKGLAARPDRKASDG